MQLSLGSWTICGLAVASSLGMAFWKAPAPPGKPFWLFSQSHSLTYMPMIAEWNKTHPPEHQFNGTVIAGPALERRLASGLLSGTPVPDAVEIEISMAAKVYAGPLDAVGLVDLTDRMNHEGITAQINAPSLAPWTTHGRIFGLPHDVHPVLLAYRADLVEAAGIRVEDIETWDDFARIMAPLMADKDRDGYPDRYLLGVWETNPASIEILILQAGGEFFDQNFKSVINSETNARVISGIVSWIAGPKRIGANAPNFDAEGNHLFLSGGVVCCLMPDWLAGVWMQDLPGLKGKVKLMPLPAWEKGGRRTSVAGGTMLSIPERSTDVENSWDFAKRLYLSRDLAETLFKNSSIITPIKTHWNNPVYDKPNPYFCGQANGRLFINEAPNVPIRTSSPFRPAAIQAVTDAIIRLKQRAEAQSIYTPSALLPFAREELKRAEAEVRSQMDRNFFQTAENQAKVSP